MTKTNTDSEPDSCGSQPELARILDLAPFQVALLDSHLQFKYVNQSFADFQGWSRESTVGKKLSQTTASFYEKISPLLNESLAGKHLKKEIELLDSNQEPRWFELELTPELDEHQKVSGLFCYLTEVTESKESERLANLIFAHAPAFISMIDLDLKYRFVNQSLLDSLGLPLESVIGKPLYELLDTKSFSVAEPYLLKALEGEESVYENTVMRQDGSELSLLVHLVPQRNSSNQVSGICALMVDTSALTSVQRKLRHNELRIETAVVGSSVGIIEFDPARPDWVFAGHIESLLGLEPGSLKDSRKLARERIHPDDVGVNEEAKRLEEDGFDTNIEMRLKTASGDYRWFSVNSRFKTNDDGKSKRIIGTISDIDELKKAQLKAAEDVKRRDEFLAMLSHELRNPLAAITFSLDWLHANDAKKLDAKSEKLLDVISRQTDHMSKLLQDLLDVTRVTQNRIDFHFDVHDINQSIRDVVDSILPAITGKNQHLIVNLATEPLMVKGDVIRLKQALANLLDNASKYTPEGGNIWLQTEEVGGRAVFSVRDSGFGIAQEALKSIFDLFFQAGQHSEQKTGGIGVGLYLVDQIVRAHSGSISATSEGPGQGSMFTICLPLTEERIQPRKSSRPEVQFHGCRAIVVEDNVDTRVSLARLLRQRGFAVTAFADGESAASALDDMNFDIAIVDIGLPGKSGLELAHEIRQTKHLNRALLIALTGYNRPADRKRISAAGFDVHVVKPADFGQLCETIAAKLPH